MQDGVTTWLDKTKTVFVEAAHSHESQDANMIESYNWRHNRLMGREESCNTDGHQNLIALTTATSWGSVTKISATHVCHSSSPVDAAHGDGKLRLLKKVNEIMEM